MQQKTCEIRDVIYGFVKLDAQELEIINQPAFQRLRRIRQLSLTEMVYPGANHTRFEHSIGVMQMATDMYDCITEKSRELLNELLSMDEAGIKRWRKVIRLAALLHDIGHPPFSHSGEDLLPLKPDKKQDRFSHEEYSIAIIKSNFKDLIEDHPINRNYGIKVEEVTSLLGDTSARYNTFALLWKELISGQLDADRADYLLRDSLHAGVSYGLYDRNRLTTCMRVGITETDAPVIAISNGGWHIAESLVIARYQMFSQVYFHKTRRIYDYHIYMATKNILLSMGVEEGCYPQPDRINDYLAFDDWTIWGALKAGRGGVDGENIVNRNHYKCMYETGLLPSEDDVQNIKLEKDRAESQGKRTYTDSASTKWYKLDKDINVFEKTSGKLMPLSEKSDIVKSMITIPQIQRLYCER